MAADIDLEAAISKGQPLPPSRLPSTTRKLSHLDGLRGLAALLVYLSHTIPWWVGTDGPLEHGFGYHGQYMFATLPFIRTVFTGGAPAVSLFFVMSGCVLSVAPLRMLKNGEAREARKYLCKAAVRRPFRLFLPVAAISLGFALCMHLPLGLAPKLSWPEAEATVMLELWKWLKEFGWTINIFAKHGTFEHWFPYNPVAWTMAKELEGSWIVYALLAVASATSERMRLIGFAMGGVTLLLVYQWELASFLFGVLLAMLNLEDRAKLPAAACHALFVAGWYIIGQPRQYQHTEIALETPGSYYLTKAMPPSYQSREYWRFWNTIGATMILYSVLRISWMQNLLQRRPMQFLGKVSFCLYLLHIPFAWTVGDRIARILGVIRQDFVTPWDHLLPVPDVGPVGLSSGLLLWQAIILPIVLWLSALATRWIDAPSVNFGKWLTTRRKPR